MKSLYNAVNMAIGMFSIIPPFKKVWCEKSAKHIMKMFPIIGFVIGLIWYGVSILLEKFNVPIMISSAILLSVPFILTGFLHLDGFMDMCDALLSRRPKEEKIRILKDSTVGAFSVISLVLVFFIEFSAINSILQERKNTAFLILIPVISRSLVAYFLITKKSIKESYFGKLYKEGTGIVDKIILIGIYVIALIAGFFINHVLGISISLAMAIIAIILVKKAEKELGGVNGDVSGYIITLSELTALIILAII